MIKQRTLLRRSVLAWLGALPFALDSRAANFRARGEMRPLDFTYQIEFIFEGRTYAGSNVARLRGRFLPAFDGHFYAWRARPLVFALGDGRILVLTPPSPTGGLLNASTPRGESDLTFQAVQRGAETVTYPAGAVPLGVIIDDPVRPQTLDALAYRAAFLGDEPVVRVTRMSVALQSRKPDPTPQASAPWLDLLQTLPIELSRGELERRRELDPDIVDQGMRFGDRRFQGLVATCQPSRKGDCALAEALVGSSPGPALRPLRRSLLRGEYCHIPLKMGVDGVLQPRSDPRVIRLGIRTIDRSLITTAIAAPLSFNGRTYPPGKSWPIAGATSFGPRGFTASSDWFGLPKSADVLNLGHHPIDLVRAGMPYSLEQEACA